MKTQLIESLHNYTDALEQKFAALEQRIAQLEEENCIRKTENETLREENEALKAEIAALATASVAFVGAGGVALDENNEPEVEVELIVSEEEDEVTAEPIVTEQQETIEESTPEEVEPKEDILPIVSQETIANTQTGKLQNNLTIKKAVVDLKGNQYKEVEKVTE